MSPQLEKSSSSNLKNFNASIGLSKQKGKHENKRANAQKSKQTAAAVKNIKEIVSADARMNNKTYSLISEHMLYQNKYNIKLPKFSFDEILNTTSKFPKIISNNIHPEDSNPWVKVYETVMGNRNDWRNFEQLCNKHYLF